MYFIYKYIILQSSYMYTYVCNQFWNLHMITCDKCCSVTGVWFMADLWISVSHYFCIIDSHMSWQTFCGPFSWCDEDEYSESYVFHGNVKSFRLDTKNGSPLVQVMDCSFSSIHIHFEVRVLSVSHLMGLAVPGYIKHWPPMCICFAGQRQTAHILILHHWYMYNVLRNWVLTKLK